MAISDKLDYLLETKQAIKTAIQGKGQSVSDTDTFRSYADKINAITTGGGSGSGDMYKAVVERTLSEVNDVNGEIKMLGGYNFYNMGSSLTGTVNLPACSYIGSYTFQYTSITGLSLPNCQEISYYAFANCGLLTEVNLPNCEKLNNGVFSSCARLTTVSLPNCLSISIYAFNSCGLLSDVYLPKCEYIGSGAFVGCSLINMDLPNCLIASSSVFSACTKLETINMPKCSSIGIDCFKLCSKLTNVNLPNLTNCGDSAFYGCYILPSLDLPLLTSASANMCRSCSALSYVNIPECKAIYGNAFYDCTNLTSISLPKVETLYGGAFVGTGLTSTSVPQCRFISGKAYVLSVQEFPKVQGIYYTAFGSHLTYVSLPECTTLSRQVFYGATNLQSLSLPKCINMQSSSIFTNCQALSALYLGRRCNLPNVATFASTPMSNLTYLGYFGSIYVRKYDLSWYQTSTNWAAYSSRITTYEPQENLLNETGGYFNTSSTQSFSLDCEIGDNLIMFTKGVGNSNTVTQIDGWTLLYTIYDKDNITGALGRTSVYTKQATSIIDGVENLPTGSYTVCIVNIKNKIPSVIEEDVVQNAYAPDSYNVYEYTKTTSNEILLFAMAYNYESYRGAFDVVENVDYTYNYGNFVIMVHSSKEANTKIELGILNTNISSNKSRQNFRIVPVELV